MPPLPLLAHFLEKVVFYNKPAPRTKNIAPSLYAHVIITIQKYLTNPRFYRLYIVIFYFALYIIVFNTLFYNRSIFIYSIVISCMCEVNVIVIVSLSYGY